MKVIKQTQFFVNHNPKMLDLQKKIDADSILGETEKERTHRIMLKYFVPKYSGTEEFKKDLYEKLLIAQKQIEEGNCLPAEVAFKKLEAKYSFYG